MFKRFNICLYSTICLGLLFFSQSTSADDQEVTLTKSDYDQSSKTYTVSAQERSKGKKISSISVAIWSQEQGQDDLCWYTSSEKIDGKLSVQFNPANHGNRAGYYKTAVYVTYTDGSKVGQTLKDTKVKMQGPSITFSNSGLSLTATTLPPLGSKIKVAVWSDEHGQDDLSWYEADSSGNLLVPYANHKGYGDYHIDTYQEKDGKLIGIVSQTTTVDKPALKSKISKVSDTQYQVDLTKVPEHIESLCLAVWSRDKGQDDLKWYQAQKQTDGSYKILINLKSHHFSLGKYQVHIYGKSQLKAGLQGLGSDSFTVTNIANYGKPKVAVARKMAADQFAVEASETEQSKYIKALELAVWSEPDQSDLYWYQRQSADKGLWIINADLKKQANKAADYHVHAYVTYSDGSQEGFILPDQTLEKVSRIGSQKQPKITSYLDEINTYPVGQCTWGVKELAPWIPNYLGNAKTWAINASVLGFRIGNKPEVGAIAVWPNEGGGYGHVAYITDVENDQKIQVKESNYAGNQSIQNFRGWFNPSSTGLTYIYPD